MAEGKEKARKENVVVIRKQGRCDCYCYCCCCCCYAFMMVLIVMAHSLRIGQFQASLLSWLSLFPSLLICWFLLLYLHYNEMLKAALVLQDNHMRVRVCVCSENEGEEREARRAIMCHCYCMRACVTSDTDCIMSTGRPFCGLPCW